MRPLQWRRGAQHARVNLIELLKKHGLDTTPPQRMCMETNALWFSYVTSGAEGETARLLDHLVSTYNTYVGKTVLCREPRKILHIERTSRSTNMQVRPSYEEFTGIVYEVKPERIGTPRKVSYENRPFSSDGRAFTLIVKVGIDPGPYRILPASTLRAKIIS